MSSAIGTRACNRFDKKTSDKYDEEMTMEMDQAFDLDQMRLSGNLETFSDNDEQ